MTFPPANFDPSIDPTADQVRALRDAGPDGPVVMLNLLKFRKQANYPAGSPHAPCSGAEAYRRYQTAFVETVGDVSRAGVVWEGKIDRTLSVMPARTGTSACWSATRAASTSSR